MKRIVLLLTLMAGLISCGNKSENAIQAKSPTKNHVEVIYFHGKQRCATCMAIEKNTQEVVDAMFANEMNDDMALDRDIFRRGYYYYPFRLSVQLVDMNR